MPIEEYLLNEKTYFKAWVDLRSKSARQVRVQKYKAGIESRKEAERCERSLLRDAHEALVKKENRGYLFGDLLDEWELASRRGDIFCRQICESTLYDYIFVIRTYATDWLKMRIDEIDKALVWAVFEKVEREVSVTRRIRLRSAIDSVYNWGILSGKIKGLLIIPTQGYKSLRKKEEKLPEILTLEEIRNLLKLAKQTDHPWFPIWTVALLTGMRSGELYALDFDSVDFENKTIYVHRNWTNKKSFGPTKGRYWRAIPMNDDLLFFLKEQKIKRGSEKSVFHRFNLWSKNQQAQVLREFCVGVGIPSIKFHTLRACFATQLIKDGVAPATVMKINGWKDLKTMQGYIRLAGIEVRGATNTLKLMPDVEVMGKVMNLFGNPNQN